MDKGEGAVRQRSKNFREWVSVNFVAFFTVIAACLGIIFGFVLRTRNLDKDVIQYISFPGELLLRALYMVVPLLIVCSIVSGLNGRQQTNLGRIGARIFIYYGCTTLIAAVIGIGMGYVVRLAPLTTSTNSDFTKGEHPLHVADSILDILRNLVTNNIVRAMFQSQQTKYKLTESLNASSNASSLTMTKYQDYVDGTNMVGIIFFSILFGISLRKLGEKGHSVSELFHTTNDIVMEIVNLIMIYSPIGIFFLILGSIAGIKEVNSRIIGVMYLSLAHLFGICVHWSILSTALYLITKRNPFRFFIALKESLLAAWSIMSSTSVLPVTIRCMEKTNKVDKKVTRLVLPIGATVNMDGNSMHFVQVAMFIAQIHNIPLNVVSIITIVFTSALASVGLAAVPNSFFAAVLVILEAVHLPSQDIVLMFTTEWILDRFRTALNVYGDCVGAAIVETMECKRGEDNEVLEIDEETGLNTKEDIEMACSYEQVIDENPKS